MGCLLTCELFHGYLYNLVFGDRTHYCIPIFLLNRHLWLTSLSLTDLPPFLFLIPELEWSFSLFLVFTVHVQYLVKLFQFLVFSLRLNFFFFFPSHVSAISSYPSLQIHIIWGPGYCNSCFSVSLLPRSPPCLLPRLSSSNSIFLMSHFTR